MYSVLSLAISNHELTRQSKTFPFLDPDFEAPSFDNICPHRDFDLIIATIDHLDLSSDSVEEEDWASITNSAIASHAAQVTIFLLHSIITCLTHNHDYQVPLHHGAALEIQDLAKQIQDQGGSIQVDVMETPADPPAAEGPPDEPTGVAPGQSDTLPPAPMVTPVTVPTVKTRSTRQASKAESKKGEKLTKKPSKTQLATVKNKQKDVVVKTEEGAPVLVKHDTAPTPPSGHTTPKTSNAATPPSRNSGKIAKKKSLLTSPATKTPLFGPLPGIVHQSSQPTSSFTIPKLHTVTKTTYPEGSYAKMLDDSAKPGMDRPVSEPDQEGWVKFLGNIRLHGGFKSQIDGKIYRVQIVAEHPLRRLKGVLMCYNNAFFALPDADLLGDPGVTVSDPMLAEPAVNGIDKTTVNFPPNPPLATTQPIVAPTVNTTTAASTLINSISLPPPVKRAQVAPAGPQAIAAPVPDVQHGNTEDIGPDSLGSTDIKQDPANNITISIADFGQLLRDNQLANLSMAEGIQSAVNVSNETLSALVAHFLKGKEDDEDKHLSRPRNITSIITDLPAFTDNMADQLSPGRFLPAGTDLKAWGNSIPDKFEARSNLALEEFGLVVNDFTAIHKAHNRLDSKLQLKHFKTDNLHKIETSSKLKFDGANFTQVSGLADIQNVNQALESLANVVAIFHRICPANPEALTLFMVVLRNYLSRAVKVTTPDVEKLFVDWNIERIAKIAAKDGTVSYKWVEDQLTRIVTTRLTKADETTNAAINILAEAQAQNKDNPAMRKKLSIALANNFPGQTTNRTATFGNTNRKRQQVTQNNSAKKQKPAQQTRPSKPTGPSFCR